MEVEERHENLEEDGDVLGFPYIKRAQDKRHENKASKER